MTSPPSPRIAARTASMPTPRPEMSLVTSAVEKPAEKSSSIARAHVDRVDRLGRDQPALGGLARRRARGRCRDRRRATVMTTLPPAWLGGDLERAGRGLARRDALLRALEAVVERVADEVHERVAERVDDGAVELGVLADELAARPACRAWSRGRARAAGSAGTRPPRGSSGPA